MIEFKAWPKTPRLFRDITITEKIDGTNAAVIIERLEQRPGWTIASERNVTVDGQHYAVAAQSRKRLIDPGADNFGFAAYVWEHAELLVEILGEGTHYGEWWGSGIQRGYGLDTGDKRFSLFNVHRYGRAVVDENFELRLRSLDVVPTLYHGPFSQAAIDFVLGSLRDSGSHASGFANPEGIIVYHSASGQVYKVLLDSDHLPKGLVA